MVIATESNWKDKQTVERFSVYQVQFGALLDKPLD